MQVELSYSVATSGVYRIFMEDGRTYVGSSAHIYNRWNQHRSKLNGGTHHTPYLLHAWQQYGSDAFTFEVLELCAVDDLVDCEQRWIDQLHPVFNSAPVAGSTLGFKHSEESRILISRRLRERPPPSEDTRRKLSASKMGHEVTDEVRQVLREANLGKHHTAETRAKMSGPRPHTKWSDERKAYMSALMKARPHPELIRNQMGHEVTDETREKLRIANLGKKRT